MTTVQSILLQRCPRCRVGRIFKKGLVMHPVCPVCGLRFEREPGYFLGAMYVSYFMAVPCIAILFFGIHHGVHSAGWAIVLAGLVFLPFVPIVVRLSRSIWIHLDRTVDATGP